MGKRLSFLLVLLFVAVTCSWGQDSFSERFKAKINSYRTFSEFDAFFSKGFGDYAVNRGGITFSLGSCISSNASNAA